MTLGPPLHICVVAESLIARTIYIMLRVRINQNESPRAQPPDAKSRGTRDNTVRLRHVEPARVPLRHATLSPSQFPDSLHRLAKDIRADHPISYLDYAHYQDGK